MHSLNEHQDISQSRDISAYFPVELLQKICEMACTDGGFTGNSLARVSKSIRETSRGARFHSVSLTSGSAIQITQFLSHFAAERATARHFSPKVRHLCLASANRVNTLKNPYYGRIAKDADTESHAFTRDVLALIRVVAPDLVTLSLINGHRGWKEELLLPGIGRLSFPLLEELSALGTLDFAPIPNRYVEQPPTVTDSDYDPSQYPPLPRLTRLHLAGSFRTSAPDLHLRRWADRAPGLTHLRMSGLSDNEWYGDLVTIVQDLVDVGAKPAFKHFNLLLIQPQSPPARGGPCGNPYMQYGRFASDLGEMHRFATRRWGLLPYVQPKEISRSPWQEYAETTARYEWLDRLAGGPGCWAAEDSASYFNAPPSQV